MLKADVKFGLGFGHFRVLDCKKHKPSQALIRRRKFAGGIGVYRVDRRCQSFWAAITKIP